MSKSASKAPCKHPSPQRGCKWCNMARKDTRYARLWWGEGGTARTGLLLLTTCKYLGAPTGETRTCKSCNTSQEVPLLGCAKHGTCTETKLLSGVQCCRICPDREAGEVPRIHPQVASQPKSERGLMIPTPPVLDLRPRHFRALVTVAVGEEGQALLAASRAHMEAYARRVGADFVVLNWPGHPAWPMSAKFMIARVLDHYDRIAYVDADILLRPGCVDLFSLCSEYEYGAVDELPWHRTQPRFGREKAYLKFRRQMGFAPVHHLPWMLNCGVQVVPRSYQHLLLPPEGPIQPAHCAEQDLINARVLDGFLAGEVKVRLLDRRANHQNWTDPGFRAATPDAILHWSGSSRERVSRAERIKEWARKYPL